MVRRVLGGIALGWLLLAPHVAAADTEQPPAVPPGGSYHVCNGLMLHVSSLNIRVHCTDGNPKDLSFISWPKLAHYWDGRSVQSQLLVPGTPVRVVFTQSMGLRHAEEITVYDSHTGQAGPTLKT
jgi:hypothetical protein